MRVNKFLAAVAIPATFAACTQEELFVAENAPVDMAMEEVVGYRTIGTDVTFSASSTGDETRMSATGNWEKTDQIGLGWLVYGNPQDEQTQANKPTESKLWANHQFVWNGEEFATQGNVYEGWYFAYYPWSYERKAGVTKFVEVNPAQKSKVWKDRLSQNLHMSTLQFIGAANMDDNNKITTPIQLRNAVNNLIVTSTPAKGSAFAEGGQLTDLAIESIKIGVDQDVFASWLTLYPRLLSTTEEGFNESLKNAMAAFKSDKTTSGRENTITTNVAEAGFVTGETANMVTIVAPYAPTTALDTTAVSIEINVAGGKFVIAYTADAEAGTTAAKNNAALVTLAKELSAGGKLTAPQTSTNPYAMVNVELNDANFQPNFDNISNIDQWIAAVELADKLDRDDLVFTVVGGKGIEFTAEKGIVDGTLVAPKKGVKVQAPAGSGNNLIINGEATWNPAINSVGSGAGIVVAKDGVLTVDGTLVGTSFVNNGIINATAKAYMTTHNHNGVKNNNRINIAYGAALELDGASAPGHIIAYEVEEDNKAEYTKIKNLITLPAPGLLNKKYAYVNTLVFDNNFNLKQNGTSSSTDEDPYLDVTTPGADGAVVGTGLNIEATGAIVEGPADIKVKNVTLTNATLKGVEIEGTVSATGSVINTTKAITGAVTATDSEIAASAITGDVTAAETTINVPTIKGTVAATDCTINGAAITGDVTAEDGVNTFNNTDITGTFTVNAGATAVFNSEDFIYVTNIVNNGTIKSNNDAFVTNVTLNPKSVTTLTDKDEQEMDWNKTIFYTGEYNNDKMTLNGAVVKYSIPAFAPSATPEDKGTATTDALEAAAKDAVVFIPEGEYAFTKTSQINLEGASIICEPGTIINSSVNSSSNKVLYYTLADTKQVVLKNFTINAGITKSDVWFRNDNMKANGKVDIIIENVTCKSMLFDFLYQTGTTANIKFINCKIDRVDLHPNLASSTINVEYDSASTLNLVAGGSNPENVHITQK